MAASSDDCQGDPGSVGRAPQKKRLRSHSQDPIAYAGMQGILIINHIPLVIIGADGIANPIGAPPCSIFS